VSETPRASGFWRSAAEAAILRSVLEDDPASVRYDREIGSLKSLGNWKRFSPLVVEEIAIHSMSA